jgi:hypothetical protein
MMEKVVKSALTTGRRELLERGEEEEEEEEEEGDAPCIMDVWCVFGGRCSGWGSGWG